MAVKPKVIFVGCGNGAGRFRLRWRQYGRAKTTATGTSTRNDCDPTCPEGTTSRIRITVRMSRIGRCGGRRVYRRFRTTFHPRGRRSVTRNYDYLVPC